MTRFPIPRPTEDQAIGRASRRSTTTATTEQLRHRLLAAVRVDDGHGAQLIARRLARASA